MRCRRQWESRIWDFSGWRMEIGSSDWVLLSSRWLLRLPSRGMKWPFRYMVESGRRFLSFYVPDIQGRGPGWRDELSCCYLMDGV